MRWSFLLVMLGCDGGVAKHNLESSAPPVASPATSPTTQSASFPRSPGPAVPVDPTPTEPPASITTFLREHADDAIPWRVTLHELSNSSENSEPLFMGLRSLRSRLLPSALAQEVIAWLGGDGTYWVDDNSRACGSVTPERGLEIARGSASLRVRYNCGYLFLTDKGFTGDRAMISSDAAMRFEDITKRALAKR